MYGQNSENRLAIPAFQLPVWIVGPALQILYWVLLAFVPSLQAQKIPEKGTPWIDNHTPEQYNYHGKIWDITSDRHGIAYMAGDAGLLEYDGQAWNQYQGSKGCTVLYWW
ncbi:MAG: hypothetical protein IPL65_11195 [Lewinellaceae bacterium]|nr:hypothetical protein [Lewinellaceae bacterium]